MNTSLQLTIDSSSLETFCKQLVQRTDDISRAHHALVTLESFIGLYCNDCHNIEHTDSPLTLIRQYTEATREQLMQQRYNRLVNALNKQDIDQVRQVYTQISRNGFSQLLSRIQNNVNQEQLNHARQWVSQWLTDARKRAQENSSYPDAFNFLQAGVDIKTYKALDDIQQHFEHQFR